MAKKKDESVSHETFEKAIEKDGEIVIVTNPDHLKPMAEPSGPPARPKPVDESHAKPMAEVKPEVSKAKVIDPKHLKPQE